MANVKFDSNSRVSLSNADSGANNTVFGKLAGNLLASGDTHNVFIGENVADADMTNAVENTAVGYSALSSLTEGDENTMIGRLAGRDVTTGSGNTMIGSAAGYQVDGGVAQCVVIGRGAFNGQATTGANGTVAIGYGAAAAIYTGPQNTIIGHSAGDAMTTGGYNVAMGVDALGASVDVDQAVAIGHSAMGGGNVTSAANGSVAIGKDALVSLTSGIGNVAIGHQALDSEDAGSYNTAVGTTALSTLNVDGTVGNVAVGYAAGRDSSTGVKNTFVGGFCGTTTVDADECVFVGYASGGDGNITSGGDGSVGVGAFALNDLTSGARNTALGYQVLDALSDGSDNTGVGYNALGASNHADSDHNTAVGVNAGDVITNGYQNTILGSGCDPSASGGVNQTVIGYAVTGQGNNTVTLGNSSVTAVYAGSDSGATVHCGSVKVGGADATLGLKFEYDQSGATTTKITANPTYTNTSALMHICVDGDANANQLVLKGDGKVGIGTASPASTQGYTGILEIANASDTALVLHSEVGGTANKWEIGNNTSGVLQFAHSIAGNGSTGTKMVIDGSGNVFIGNTSNRIAETSGGGATITPTGQLIGVVAEGNPLGLNRLTNDGSLVEFRQAGSIEGTINVSSSTVSLVGFSGRHESSGIADNVALGTVVSTIDELDVHGETGKDRADHAKIEVSDSVGDKRVYGVLVQYDENFNKPIIAAVGLGSVRVTGACEGGDLLESNGDGTAKVQSDDIIKSKTIGKVTIGDSNTGVKLVSCVLYCG